MAHHAAGGASRHRRGRPRRRPPWQAPPACPCRGRPAPDCSPSGAGDGGADARSGAGDHRRPRHRPSPDALLSWSPPLASACARGWAFS
jgi:hypothetical protein